MPAAEKENMTMFDRKWTALALTLLASTALAAPLTPPPDEWLTPGERSAFKSTPRFDETMTFCRRLADKSPRIHVTSYGISPLGRDLPLVIVSKDGKATPTTAHDDGRIVLFVQNGIHAGECDGKDGASCSSVTSPRSHRPCFSNASCC
jgi:hypothetical protein